MDSKNAITAKVNANIAIIKYWGKKDEQLKIPFNSSISLTLDAFYTLTSMQYNDEAQDLFYLNGVLQDAFETEKVSKVINLFRNEQKFVTVKSKNSMPTAAGLSSSSSGLAALVVCADAFFKTNRSKSELSRLARIGSGSACRSLYGPLAIWKATDDDKTAIAYPVTTSMDLSMIMVILNKEKKKVLSRDGMRHCVETSSLFPTWAKQANEDAITMLTHIQNSDFKKIGELMEKNTLLMHETTKFANPPFSYLSDQTLECIDIIKDMRKNGLMGYFTMDAGPNVKILCKSEDAENIRNYLLKHYDTNQIIVSKAASQYEIFEGDHV